MTFLRLIPIALCALILLPDGARSDPLKLETYLDFENVSDPEISPDGGQVIYSRSRIDKMNDRNDSALWIMNADGGKNRMLVKGSNARWSPDGTRVAYIAQDDAGNAQIFVRWMDAEGATSQITHINSRPMGIFWSPDGTRIAFLSRVPHKTDFTVKLPGKPAGAKWTDDPLVVETLFWRQDRIGVTNDGWDHIFVVPADGGTPRQITEGNWHAQTRRLGAIRGPAHLSWSPDGTKILFDGLAEENADMKFTQSHIYAVDVSSREITQLTQGEGNYSDPVYSPNGNAIAYNGYTDTRLSYTHTDLYAMNADGSNARKIGGKLPSAPGRVTWAANSRGVYFDMDHEGDRNIYYTALDGQARQVTEGDRNMFLSNVSDRGVAVATNTSLTEPGDVIRFNLRDGGGEQQLTHVNADVLEGVDLGDTIEFWYDSTENTRVQGWAVLPPDYDSSKKYPLILSIHGGPHAMYRTSFNFMFQEFAAEGYVVLFVNPRGSTGYGEDFAASIENMYPGDRDFADLMAGVDHMIDEGYADPDRLFVTGCSGGGILTAWTVTHTDRFKAAVSRCVVSDWIGMFGTTDVSGWMVNFFEPPFWEDPTVWLEHSALMHVDNVTTPTLMMTGKKDLRTPDEQAEQFYAAMKYLGVPTKFISVNGEYHGTGSIPSNFLRRQLYILKWFRMYDPVPQEDMSDTPVAD